MDPDSTQHLIATASKAVIQFYAYVTLIVGFLSALALVALARLPRQNERFFVILLLLFWTVYLFVTAASLLGSTAVARRRIIIICFVYALMPVLLSLQWLEQYLLFAYQWLQLTCWAWPSLESGTCAFSAPDYLGVHGIGLTFIIAIIGLILFSAVKPIRDVFKQQNRLETLLRKPE